MPVGNPVFFFSYACHEVITGNPVALWDTQHAGEEIVTRPKSEYFANDPECHDLLPCILRSHSVADWGDVPQGCLWVESRPCRLRPCGPVRSCGPVPFAVTDSTL